MKSVLLAAVLAMILTGPVRAGYDEGLEAANRGDYATALAEWRPLAEQGNASPQFNLALMYNQGWGVPQDHAEAAIWYRRAAAQGHPKAQYNLALMYDYGEGVALDDAEAVRLYLEAANQGHIGAQYNIGAMYFTGEGVAADYVQAYMWSSIAAALGDDESRQNRDIVARDMTSAEIAEAQSLARQWLEAYQE